jgi:hypothetical protein
MKPVGHFRLTDSTGGTTKSEDIDVTPTGGTGPFGEPWTWVTIDGHDLLKSGWRTLTLEWDTATSGTATFGLPPGPVTTVPFTCAPR